MNPPLLPKDEMERAFRTRDASYDGIFFAAVRTTGIFCRPSCAARKPLSRNVQYFPTVREALFAGFRPCRRCRPLFTDGRPPEWVDDLLRLVDSDPTARVTDALLRARGVSPERARRFFQDRFGMTFQAYCRGRRLGRALGQIRSGASLDDVALGHGYESHSGFREAFAKTFGRPPGRGRELGCVLTAWIESPLGPLLAGATEDGVCLLEFTDRRMLETQFATLRRRLGAAIVPGESEAIDRLRDELSRYFEGRLTAFTVPLAYPGTPFQVRVWEELRRIPYGQTRSYVDVARAIGAPGASRAVGTANGCNRIAIVIPCHRVVNANGELGGYGGGLWRKRFLLDLERATRGADRPPAAPSASRAGNGAGPRSRTAPGVAAGRANL